MGNEQTAKICAVCGEDCSNKPRTKDNKGRYYCKPCHDRAMQRRTQSVVAPPPPPKRSAKESFSMLEQLVAEAPSAPGQGHCPSCGQAFGATTVICLNCGFNVQTGQRLGVAVQNPKRDWSGAANQLGANGPMLSALLALLIYVAVAAMGMLNDEKPVAAAIYALWHFPYSLAVAIFALILAFRESIVTGICTLCVPCYVLYFVYGICDNMWVRYHFAVYFLGSIAWIALFYDTFPERNSF